MAQLIFYPEDHTYWLDGVLVPGVTELVKILGDDMDDMSADMENKMDIARERGIIGHAVIAQMLQGETDIDYPSAYEPYIEAVRLFLSEHEIIPAYIETPIASETSGYAGTPDLLCWFDGVLSVLDYKFVSQIAKTKVKAQLNGYLEMYIENGVFPENLYAVQFLPDTYRLYPVTVDCSEFRLCLEVYKQKNRKHPRGRIE